MSSLTGYIDSQTHKVSIADIYYINSVDSKSFAYCKQAVYEIKEKLYEIEALELPEFLRISKSTILNLSTIKYLQPDISGRLEAVLTNGEKVVISRNYVKELKKAFGV